jgi:hypothetical protein
MPEYCREQDANGRNHQYQLPQVNNSVVMVTVILFAPDFSQQKPGRGRTNKTPFACHW